MSGIVGLHHVQVSAPAGSDEATRDFYGRVLGLPEVAKPPVLAARGGVWFRSPDLELHVGIEDDFRPARKSHPALLVADLPAYAEELASAGVEVRWDDNFPGYRRCYVDDPHGNRIELLEALSAPPGSPR